MRSGKVCSDSQRGTCKPATRVVCKLLRGGSDDERRCLACTHRSRPNLALPRPLLQPLAATQVKPGAGQHIMYISPFGATTATFECAQYDKIRRDAMPAWSYHEGHKASL